MVDDTKQSDQQHASDNEGEAATDYSSKFAPTELVYLNGEQFASKAPVWNIELLHTDTEVSMRELGRAILAAAILVNERDGTLRFETGRKKALFGLRERTALFLHLDNDTIEWPEHSLEAQIPQRVSELQRNRGRVSANELIYHLLRWNNDHPWWNVIKLIQGGLAARGLLNPARRRRLRIFTIEEYELPERTATLAAEESVAPLQELFDDTKQDRGDVWRLLLREIRNAVEHRTRPSEYENYV